MKVLLVDDHPLILTALQSVIRGLGDDVTVIGVATAEAARAALREDDSFDLVLLDLALGEVDGFEVLTELRATWPAIPVVVVSASERTSDVIRAIDLGAMGFVPKRSSNDALFDALRLVMSGGLYVPPSMLGLDVRRQARRRHRARGDAQAGRTRLARSRTSSTRLRWSPSASRRARPRCWRCCCRACRTS